MREERHMPCDTRVKLIDVPPNGSRVALGCGPAGGGLPTELHTYPQTSHCRAIRAVRIVKALSLRQAAEMMGLTAVELSAVERGAKQPEDWQQLYDALEQSR
jgi:hypothetical protein